MKKYIFIALLFLTSCSARKVQIEKENVKKDSIATTTTNVKTVDSIKKTDSTTINTNINIDEIIVTPIDSTKPIYINNIPYKNVILKIKKTKANTLYTNNKTASETKVKDSVVVAVVKKSEASTKESKKVDSKPRYYYLLALLVLILIMYFLWRQRR